MKVVDLETGALREGGAPRLFSRDHIGVLAQYATVGLVDAVMPATIYPFLQNYLNVSGTTAVTATTLVALPWSFKVFYGILSDCVPIRGYRRRPYMVLGWMICIVMLFLMGCMTVDKPYWNRPEDAYIDREHDPLAYAMALARANKEAPTSGGKYVLVMMFSAFGYVMSDVCADGIVVELAQREPLNVRGRTQSAVYSTRTAFNIVGQLIVGFAFNGREYGGAFDFALTFPMLMLSLAFWILPIIPIAWFFINEKKHEPATFSVYMRELWSAIQTRAVHQIMFYQFFSGIFAGITYTSSSPVQRYLVHVTPINSVISGIVGTFAFLVGIAVTGKFGLHWNWRAMIVLTGALVIFLDAITTFVTIWDIYRSQWFWLGLPIAINLPAGINFLIGTFVTIELVGEGNEGAMYGLLTTVSNLSSPFAATLTKIIDAHWDLSNERIQEDTEQVRLDISYTILIMYATNVISWMFLVFLPPQKAETQVLKRTGGSSKLLGGLTIAYVAFALLWSITTNILGIFESTACLVIAGGKGC
ncbi:hypothetical protein Poli38472_001851 [Pythium oligandrum]|uniref:Folate-Biopterin Transporter (FBT) Family n=1 Tax=Pythium oligandrum TaxID=41045 RepID=A0A8K1CVZ3_PYTOL|nr:hypothetical protein Poli38472_001851 [Pythium oligandrum]|eukprot:TMW69695.1 hypothetical protein Poli38472_001851 [Pythium oligandrum]